MIAMRIDPIIMAAGATNTALKIIPMIMMLATITTTATRIRDAGFTNTTSVWKTFIQILYLPSVRFLIFTYKTNAGTLLLN